ncbi:MAG: hypothetical protein AAGA48_34070 [Myxococcota bacterium]
MSRGPRRLMEDPDFKWETGCDLGDEKVLTGGYDLARMRAAVLAGIPAVGDGVPVIRPRRPWGWWLGGIAGVTAIVASFWLGTQVSGVGGEEQLPAVAPPEVIEAPVRTPDPEVLRPEAPETVNVEVSVEGAPIASPKEVPQVVIQPPKAASKSVVERPIVDDGVAAAVEAPEPAPAAAPPVESRLEAEMAVYEPAADALQSGEAAAAARGFREYLAQFPTGTLRPEAELGLLWALHREGDAARTERWAAYLLEQSVHEPHHDDIRELRAQALVRLGRCEEAIASISSLPSRVIGPIRRACRRR